MKREGKRKVKLRMYKRVRNIMVLAILALIIVVLVNKPLISIRVSEVRTHIKSNYRLTILLTWFMIREEAKYLKFNVSLIKVYVELISNKLNITRELALLPFKPGRIFSIAKGITLVLPEEAFPLKLFVMDNVSKVKYPIGLIGVYSNASFPLSTYLYQASFKVYTLGNEALITESSKRPIHVKVLIRRLTKVEVLEYDVKGTNTTVIHGPYVNITIINYLVLGPLTLRITDNYAELYPQDNIVTFILIIIVLTGLIPVIKRLILLSH